MSAPKFDHGLEPNRKALGLADPEAEAINPDDFYGISDPQYLTANQLWKQGRRLLHRFTGESRPAWKWEGKRLVSRYSGRGLGYHLHKGKDFGYASEED